MKLTSFMALRPVFFFIALALLVMVLPCVVVPCWYSMVKHIEREMDYSSRILRWEVVSEINNTAELLAPISSSAPNLATVLSSTDNRSNLSFSDIQDKVAPALFQSLMLVPYSSQVSYIGLDGLFFSFYFVGGGSSKILAAYGNCTFTCDASNSSHIWYTQLVDRNGELYGEAVRSEPLIRPDDPRWIGEGVKSGNGIASLGRGWNDAEELLILNNAACYGVDGKAIGVVSIGFVAKEVARLFTRTDFHGGSLYLTATVGTVLVKGLENTLMLVANNSVAFEFSGVNVANLSCQSRDWSVLHIGGTSYDVYCSPIEILGLKSVYALALPHKGLRSQVERRSRVSLILLVAMLVAMLISIFSFVFLMGRAARREMILCSSLIKEMEATHEAERKSMSKSIAFAKASHDVRASLAGIIGLIDLSYEEVARGSELEANLRQMDVCAKDLLGLLNSVLDTSKIEAGKMQLEEEEFDLAQLLEDVADLFHPVGMKKDVDVVLDPHDGSVTKSPRVKGDRGKLKQILCNLLSNAVKFTCEGHVSIRAWINKPTSETSILASSSNQKSMRFVFEVEDTGKGIPKEERVSVFQNYFQVKDSALGQGGTGLGLGIVQSLVRLMGGDIRIVDKENDENGTCFRFNVMLIATCGSPNRQIGADGGSNVVLMIKNEGRRRMLHKFMERRGLRVWIVERQEHLDSVLKKIKLKLVLSSTSDVMSPRSSSAKDVPLSSLDQKLPQVEKDSSCFVLIVIDARVGPFAEICKVVAEFRDGFNVGSCRVVWLEKPGLRMEEGMVDPNDIITSKPFHGTRLYEAIKTLPELGSSVYDDVQERSSSVALAPGFGLREAGSSSSVGPLKGKMILVAEDSLFLRTLAMKMVTKLGATAQECENGKKALELVCNGFKYQQAHGASESVPYDCILMDCEMPVMNGYEAAKLIREAEKQYGVRIPIIAITSHTSEEETRKMSECGMDVYLCKPLKAEHLLEAISYIGNK